MSKEKYGITDEHYICDSAIFNTETDEVLRLYQICDLLNQQNQRISELEEQLKNAIVPKFKIGDKVYAIINTFAYTDVLPVEIRDTHLLYEVWDGQDTTKQHFTRIFATKEEAQAKLEEYEVEDNG